jgi:hypothetical protein
VLICMSPARFPFEIVSVRFMPHTARRENVVEWHDAIGSER